MTTVYFSDLDGRIIADIVENEVQDSHNERTFHAYHMLLDTFRTIAGEDVDINGSDAYYELSDLAERAAVEWSERYASVPDRRVVFIKMFPDAEKIIATIPPKQKTPDRTCMDIAEALTTQQVYDFRMCLDSLGYPSYWTNEQRIFAIQNDYNAASYKRNRDYLTAIDVAWAILIMEGYKETA